MPKKSKIIIDYHTDDEEDLAETKPKKWYIHSGKMSSYTFERSFQQFLPKNQTKRMTEYLKEQGEDGYIEYLRVSIYVDTDTDYEFSSIWFLDINLDNGKYQPVLKTGINTSSVLALEMCGMEEDEDEDEEDEEDMLYDLECILSLVDTKYQDKIRELVINEPCEEGKYKCQRCDMIFEEGSEASRGARIDRREIYCGDCNRWFKEQDELSDCEA